MKRLLLLLALAVAGRAVACTNLIVSKGASTDGSTFITYAADSHTRYGQLRYCAAADHQPGEMLRLYNYGSLKLAHFQWPSCSMVFFTSDWARRGPNWCSTCFTLPA